MLNNIPVICSILGEKGLIAHSVATGILTLLIPDCRHPLLGEDNPLIVGQDLYNT